VPRSIGHRLTTPFPAAPASRRSVGIARDSPPQRRPVCETTTPSNDPARAPPRRPLISLPPVLAFANTVAGATVATALKVA
jgi:hypothetical protein